MSKTVEIRNGSAPECLCRAVVHFADGEWEGVSRRGHDDLLFFGELKDGMKIEVGGEYARVVIDVDGTPYAQF